MNIQVYTKIFSKIHVVLCKFLILTILLVEINDFESVIFQYVYTFFKRYEHSLFLFWRKRKSIDVLFGGKS